MAGRGGIELKARTKSSRKESKATDRFFRNPSVFHLLQQRILPKLLRAHWIDSPIRLWVPQCGSGEEVYSLAICCHERIGAGPGRRRFQILATDHPGPQLDQARAGLYPARSLEGISAERLERYFHRSGDSYQITDHLRSFCVFAQHELLQDPPFSRLDLIDAANLTVPWLSEVEARLFPVLHFALNASGCLILPEKQEARWTSPFFLAVASGVYLRVPAAHLAAPSRGAAREKPPAEMTPLLHRQVERMLLARYSPPVILMDAEREIVEVQGHSEAFLGDGSPHPPGTKIQAVLQQALVAPVQAVLDEAERKWTLRCEHVRLLKDGSPSSVRIEVVPFRCQLTGQRFFILGFPEPKEEEPLGVTSCPSQPAPDATDQEVDHLRRALNAAQEELRSLKDKQDQSHLELVSINEVIQMSNEILKSTNERLETAKEELQSTNEELTVLNNELQNRNQELNRTRADLNGLILSLNLPILVLGNDLTVRFYTPQASQIFNLIAADTGRKVTDLKSPLPLPDLHPLIDQVRLSLEPQRFEFPGPHGSRSTLLVNPYRTPDEALAGFLLTLQVQPV